jgi:hypothetical protein
MDPNLENVLDIIENFKEKLTDLAYNDLMKSMMAIHKMTKESKASDQKRDQQEIVSLQHEYGQVHNVPAPVPVVITYPTPAAHTWKINRKHVLFFDTVMYPAGSMRTGWSGTDPQQCAITHCRQYLVDGTWKDLFRTGGPWRVSELATKRLFQDNGIDYDVIKIFLGLTTEEERTNLIAIVTPKIKAKLRAKMAPTARFPLTFGLI